MPRLALRGHRASPTPPSRGNQSPTAGAAGSTSAHTYSFVNVTNTTISDNTAAQGGGGAQLWGDHNEQSVTVTGTTISGNHANGDGWRRVIQWGVGGPTTFANSTVSGNTAAGEGGGLYFYDSAGAQRRDVHGHRRTPRRDHRRHLPVHRRRGREPRAAAAATTTRADADAADHAARRRRRAPRRAEPAVPPATPCTRRRRSPRPRSPGRSSGATRATTSGWKRSSPSRTTCSARSRRASSRPTPAATSLGVDPELGPLQNNGGPTATHALLPGSPAKDAGPEPGARLPGQRVRPARTRASPGWSTAAPTSGRSRCSRPAPDAVVITPRSPAEAPTRILVRRGPAAAIFSRRSPEGRGPGRGLS